MLPPANNRARQLNKKGRQIWNVKLRKEIKRQREFDVVMVFVPGDDGVEGTDDVIMAMNRLIEEHVDDEGMHNSDDIVF